MKAFLTALVLFGIGLFVAWPWLVGPRPSHGHPHEAQVYLVRLACYVSMLLVVWFAASVCAWVLAKRAREEYQEEALSNMRVLIESTLEDHRKKVEKETNDV